MSALLTNLRLDHFCLTSPEPETLARFYGRSLDMAVESRQDGFLAFGPERKVLFRKGPKGEAAYSAYSFPNLTDLNAYRATMKAQSVTLLPSPSPLFGGEAFAVADPDGNIVVFGARLSIFSFAGQSQRLAGRLQHFVTTSTAIDAAMAFYRDVLGFRVSDEVKDEDGKLRAVFFRGDQEHHSRAIFAASEKRLDHHCYEAGDWMLIRDWCDRMGDERISLKWGPGRHGPGHNLFFMFHDCDGNWIEISAELDVIPDNAPTGIWPHEARTLNTWGQAFLRS